MENTNNINLINTFNKEINRSTIPTNSIFKDNNKEITEKNIKVSKVLFERTDNSFYNKMFSSIGFFRYKVKENKPIEYVIDNFKEDYSLNYKSILNVSCEKDFNNYNYNTLTTECNKDLLPNTLILNSKKSSNKSKSSLYSKINELDQYRELINNEFKNDQLLVNEMTSRKILLLTIFEVWLVKTLNYLQFSKDDLKEFIKCSLKIKNKQFLSLKTYIEIRKVFKNKAKMNTNNLRNLVKRIFLDYICSEDKLM